MGEKGPGAYKIWLNCCSPEYRAMLCGPTPATSDEIKTVRRHWRDGGRELVMRDWDVPGARPLVSGIATFQRLIGDERRRYV